MVLKHRSIEATLDVMFIQHISKGEAFLNRNIILFDPHIWLKTPPASPISKPPHADDSVPKRESGVRQRQNCKLETRK